MQLMQQSLHVSVCTLQAEASTSEPERRAYTLEQQLRDANMEVSNLTAQLEDVRKKADDYQAIAQAQQAANEALQVRGPASCSMLVLVSLLALLSHASGSGVLAPVPDVHLHHVVFLALI